MPETAAKAAEAKKKPASPDSPAAVNAVKEEVKLEIMTEIDSLRNPPSPSPAVFVKMQVKQELDEQQEQP